MLNNAVIRREPLTEKVLYVCACMYNTLAPMKVYTMMDYKTNIVYNMYKYYKNDLKGDAGMAS